MKENEEYKEYPLEFRGDPFYGISYFITVNSNNKKLKFNIDSGAETSLISNPSLRGCCYMNTKTELDSKSVLGSVKTRIVFLDFILDDVDFNSVDEHDRHRLLFTVVLKKDKTILNNMDYDGLLGSNFLQYCDVNFREGYIRVYKDQLGGKVTSTLLEPFKGMFEQPQEG